MSNQAKCFAALTAAYIAVDKPIADAINKAVRDYISELEEDKAALDFLQQGHCVLCLAKEPIPVFEIDGHQGAPRDADVRKAIKKAMNEANQRAIPSTSLNEPT